MTVPAKKILPLHDVKDVAKLNALVESMTANGWIGRPILAFDGANEPHEAITGSHRIAAAKIADIEVPIALIKNDDVSAEFVEDWQFANDDWDRQGVFADHGMTEAAELMQAEIDANKAEW